MTEVKWSSSQVLSNSQQIITLLEQHSDEQPDMHRALMRHWQLHQALEAKQAVSEQALSCWQQALTRRWQWEVAGQRVYLRIRRVLVRCFGEQSHQVQALAPSETVGTAAELLRTLQGLYALLSVLSSLPIDDEMIAQVDIVCQELERALQETQRCEQDQRSAAVELQLTRSLYQQTLAEARQLLMRHLNRTAVLDALDFYTE